MDAVGDGDDGGGVVDTRPHGARRLAVELGHRIGAPGEAQPCHRHVEGVAADLPQLGLHQLAARPETVQIPDGVDLVARGHRGMSGEDDLLAQLLPRRVEVGARLDAIGDELDAREHRVPLVEVIEIDGKVEGAEGPNPPDAQEHFLGDAAVGGRVVEAAGDPAVPLVHRLDQVKGSDGVAFDLPHEALDLARAHPDAHAKARVAQGTRRKVAPRVVGIAVGADALDGIALRPAEADAHHGKAEVARGLHEVAGEDAESARIGVELLVEPVLHREVGDERRHVERIR